MSNPSLSLKHLVQRPETGEQNPPLVVFLHGIGSNEQDLFGLAPYLDQRCIFVSVRAPNPYNWVGFSWFDIQWLENGISINFEQAKASRELLVKFIGEAVAAYGADPQRVYLVGFSQGSIMSLWLSLSEPELTKGAILMSGRLPAEMRAETVDAERLRDKPLLVVHGTRDQTLPISNGRQVRDFLQTLPVDLSYHEYEMGHEVNHESLAEVASWLRQQLDS